MKKLALAFSLVVLAACSKEHAPTMSPQATVIAYNDASTAGDTTKLFAVCTDRYANALRPQVSQFIQSCVENPSKVSIIGAEKKSDTETVVAFTAIAFEKSTGRQLDSSSVLCQLVRQGGDWKVNTFQVKGAR